MTAVDWTDANRRLLFAEIRAVQALLDSNAGTDPGELEAARAALPGPAAIDVAGFAFQLSDFERQILLLCAGVELVADVALACAPGPSFQLALSALPGAHWSATSADAPLRRCGLVEPAPGEELLRARLRIDERVLHYLLGVPALDRRLLGLVVPLDAEATGDALPSHEPLVARLVGLWSSPPGGPHRPVAQVCGPDPAGNAAVVAVACARLGLALHVVRAGDVPPAAADRETLARLWEREAALGASVLLVDCDDGDGAEVVRAARALVERINSPVVVAAREPFRLHRRVGLRLELGRPTAADQLGLWRSLLGGLAANGHTAAELEPVVAQFQLGVSAVRAAAAEVVERAAVDHDAPLGRLAWDACRTQARPSLEDLAQHIEPAAGWDDLVLPPDRLRLLRQLAAQVRCRATVHGHWGFATRGAGGLGVAALFAGASGTGKTMAAEVLASELGLDLYRIDLSQVVSKYIGETEKNLRRIFDAAETGGALLLFDEADALFGKRSEVRDSHDRYANLEVSYLLQRMEQYSGLAVLTTNMRNALDHAFLRRLRFVVEFPFPDVVERAAIWRRIFPPATPLAALDLDRLAQLHVSGGVIRSIALHAAFLAADAGEPVGMGHLRRAAHDEYTKLEKPYGGELG